MMKLKQLTIFLILILNQTVILSQNNNADEYIKQKAVELMNPHVNLNFSYTNSELINKAPKLKIKIPKLSDTLSLQKKLKNDYSDRNIFLNIGILYQRFGMIDNAYRYFVKAYNLINSEIKKDSSNADYYADMAELYLTLKNQEYAQAFLNMTYQLNPDDSMVISILPTYLAQSGNFKQAEEIVAKAMKKNPEDVEAYMNYYSIQLFKILNDSLQKTQLANKKNDEILNLDKLEEAAKKYNNLSFYVLRDVVDIYILLLKSSKPTYPSEIEFKLSETDKAELKKIIKSLNKIISNNTYNNKYLLYKALGFAYLLQNKPNETIEQFKQMMNFWPEDQLSDAYDLIFATEFYIKKDTTAALKSLLNKIEHQKTVVQYNAADYSRLGNLYLQMHNYDKAKNAYNQALKINKQSITANLGLSVIEMIKMNFQEANKYMNNAYQTDKNNYATYTLFGMLTILAKDYEQAKSALEQALQLNPENDITLEVYNKFFN